MKRILLHVVYVAVASLLGLVLFPGLAQPNQLTAYVASADRRIHVVDLENGAVLAASGPIDGLGAPTSVELDETGSILYVGSELGFRQNDYYPLVAVNVKDDFAVIGRYTLNPARSTIDNSVLNRDVHAVYRVIKSRSKDRLFLSYSAPGHGLATEFDVATRTITREMPVPVTPNSILSADGVLVAEMYPSGSRTDDGKTTQWPGGVGVREIATGKVVSKVDLIDDKGLHPPWGKLASPFLYLARPQNVLNVYDRDSGRKMASLNLGDLTGLMPTGGEPRLLQGSTHVVLTMVKPATEESPGEAHGFVVVIDYVTGKIVRTIEVGPEPTNVVLPDISDR